MQSKQNEVCVKQFLSLFLKKTVIDLSNSSEIRELSSSNEHTNFALKNFSLSQNLSQVAMKFANTFPFDSNYVKISRHLFETIKTNEDIMAHFRRFYKSVD